MNVMLISLEPEVYSYGLRILSSCLREKRHHTGIVFVLPESLRNHEEKFKIRYNHKTLHNILRLCQDSSLIGISLMSNQFMQAIQITKFLKAHNVKAPIVWGGVQPTVEPEECLKFADIVCLGEGEGALTELADRLERDEPCLDIKNMWFKTDSGIVRNELRPLIQNLDTIPFPDYSCENHFIIEGGNVTKLTTQALKSFQGERFRGDGKSIPYMFMTSRGCPFSCTYCGNSVYKRLYSGQKLLRWRSSQNIVDELKMINRTLGPISYVYMVDDNFTARPTERLREFCSLYKKEVGIPFFAQVSPLTITEEKMDLIFEAGCSHVTMGVETANSRVAEIYNRTREHKALPAAIALVEKYRSRMAPPPTYQFIIDNPYETTEEMVDTLRLALSFPRPWHNPIYSLMLFPGVPLYEKALTDGIVIDKNAQIYTRNWLSQSKPFFQLWIRLYHKNVSPALLRGLLSRLIVTAMTSDPAGALLRTKGARWLLGKM